jgi:hypothetical protein
MARDQVEMQMAGTLAKGDRIHPIAARELLHQLRRPLHHQAPGLGFLSGEVDRTAQMAPGIETTPPEQWRRLWMMAQQPIWMAPDFHGIQLHLVRMQGADATRQC